MKPKLIIITGAGISAESGIKTFRDSNGLWKQYRFEEVASPEAWEKHPDVVLEFYNQRRKQLFEVEPNEAHKALVKLESKFDVKIITQNVDDLHERAGSSNVIHLHGELKKARSTVDPALIYELKDWELKIGDLCEKGSQLRPDIVWFGEPVPMMYDAIKFVKEADFLLVIGTSLAVYPAAELVNHAKTVIPKYYIDPKAHKIPKVKNLKIINEKATIGVPALVSGLLSE